MAVNAPFTRSGNTVTFTASASAPTPVQAVSSTLGGNQYRIINAGSVVVFMGIGTTAAFATDNAAVITSSSGAFPLLPGTDEILTFVPNAYFTGITEGSGCGAGNCVVYITPGDGS